MAEISYHTVARLLKADFDTGKLFWLPRTPDMFNNGGHSAEHSCAAWNSRYAGNEAFTHVNAHGYRVGDFLGGKRPAHRVIWLLHSGEWPPEQIDHINGDRSDNRIVNLRAVTITENARNHRRKRHNTSGVVGVFWSRASGKWKAQISEGGRHRHLGLFLEISDAVAARKTAEAKLGYHPNHGR